MSFLRFILAAWPAWLSIGGGTVLGELAIRAIRSRK
jgi:hypothetical protein